MKRHGAICSRRRRRSAVPFCGPVRRQAQAGRCRTQRPSPVMTSCFVSSPPGAPETTTGPCWTNRLSHPAVFGCRATPAPIGCSPLTLPSSWRWLDVSGGSRSTGSSVDFGRCSAPNLARPRRPGCAPSCRSQTPLTFRRARSSDADASTAVRRPNRSPSPSN